MYRATLLMRGQLTMSLSTHSLSMYGVSMQGYPFGSVAPFLITEKSNLVVCAFDISQHACNMKKYYEVSRIGLCAYDSQQTITMRKPICKDIHKTAPKY